MRGGVDDVAAGHVVEAREELVVLREVGVPDDVRGDERVLGERVRVHEEGAARVAREHDFEDLRMPHALAHELVDVAHAEGPVRHADRQAVDGDFGHQALRRELEVDRVEPLALREPLDALGVLLQFSHGRYSLRACSVKNSRIARQMSSWLPRWLTPTGAPRALNSLKVSASCVSRGRNVATPPVST